MNLSGFWYVAADSRELARGAVIARTVAGESLALFRDESGRAVAIEDRCRHRNAPLSCGRVESGRLRCGYHGWLYDRTGRVVEIPSLIDASELGDFAATTFPVVERQGYVYVRPARGEPRSKGNDAPFELPMWEKDGWQHVRLVHPIDNDVTNCVENFIDVPHTAYVHPTTFRPPARRRIDARVVRDNGTVTTTYEGEALDGVFRWFLNPSGGAIVHVDRFLMPNVTSVEYRFGPRRHLFITSQSVPVDADRTIVYTDLAFDYGVFGPILRPIVARQARRIIAEDMAILAAQKSVLRRGGRNFLHAEIDVPHRFVESIRHEIEEGRDPRLLPREEKAIAFLV